jgi:hypothetical protein
LFAATVKPLLLFAVLLIGCTGKLPDDSLLDSASATLESGGGHGATSSFDLTIKGDGSEIFHGYGTLLFNDTEVGHIPREDAHNLYRDFYAHGFDFLSSRYGGILGGGRRTIAFTIDGKTRKVFEEGHAPHQLYAIERAFDSIGRVARWVGTRDDILKIMHAASSAYFPGKDSMKRVLDSLDKAMWTVKDWRDRMKWNVANVYPLSRKYDSLDRMAQKAPVDSTRKALQAIYSRLNLREIDSITQVRNATHDHELP